MSRTLVGFFGSVLLPLILIGATSAHAIDYSYDELNRLTQVVYDDDSRIDYTYDAAGNRLTRVVSEDNDGDGIFFSGGVNPCAGGQTTGCEDNCPGVGNADQADLDADVLGNACDEDDDGDGLLDIYETDTRVYNSPTDTGSDPLNSDTDGDGISDGDEVIAGTNPNGGPSPVVPALGVLESAFLILALLIASWFVLHRSREGLV